MPVNTIDGELYSQLITAGAANLSIHEEEVNNLNVFPIPDGDTGSNMLLTMNGGKNAIIQEANISKAAQVIASGMLLGARGNSGVILSQFFDGISSGFADLATADVAQFGIACREGVKHAYEAVMTPVEGTILTVVKDATEYACSIKADSILDFIENFIAEAKLSLERTPNLLPVLKKAGVVDSGGAGLIYIMEGMKQFLKGETISTANKEDLTKSQHGGNFGSQAKGIDLNKFTSDSILEFGYCTELLLRLQNAKCDVENFSVETIKEYLDTIGDSIVAFKTGSIIKIHVHTKTPGKVFDFCQQYGEFLTVKVENMSLQHNNLDEDEFAKPKKDNTKDAKKYGVVAVASGSGIQQMFREHGADVVINGGQSMNPSAEDFIKAFKEANAETIFVFPNNGNVILAAKQAAKLFQEAQIEVIETKTIGPGLDTLLVDDINMGIEGVDTYMISHCVRDAEMDGKQLHAGDYIGFLDKKILVASSDRKKTAFQTVEGIDFTDHEVCILIRGIDSTSYEEEEVRNYLMLKHPGIEVYEVEGGQDIYSYIFIVE